MNAQTLESDWCILSGSGQFLKTDRNVYYVLFVHGGVAGKGLAQRQQCIIEHQRWTDFVSVPVHAMPDAFF